MALHIHRLKADVGSQLGHARDSVERWLAPYPLSEQRRIGRQLFAHGRGPGPGDDDPRVVGHDDGVETLVVTHLGKLVLKRDQRVVAASASSILERGHVRIVPRSFVGGQDSRESPRRRNCPTRPTATQ
jgi:hypothetical protein